jgi:predicted protein tyrosine phosphatase
MIIKSPMNALHNVTNPCQGKDKRVLCLCSAGILRSPSCAVVLNSKYGYNTRAAGVTDYALIPVSTALLEWADEIICVEQEVYSQLMYDIQQLVNQGLWVEEDVVEIKCKTITLDIPDVYEQMNPTLQRIIIEQYEEAINEN